MKIPKLKLGTVYQIEWYDHFATDNKSSEEATKHRDVVLTSWGRLVGVNKKYIILCENWEDDTSTNNDNIHIMKIGVKNIKEMK